MTTTTGPSVGGVDAATVAAVLYLAPFTPAEWDILGPARLGRYVTAVAADPRCRVADLVAFVAAARHDPAHPLPALDLLAAAEQHAPRVVAAVRKGKARE